MIWIVILLLLSCGGACDLSAQTTIDTVVQMSDGDESIIWIQIPANYNSANPPAILVYWHGNLATQHDLLQSQFLQWGTEANERGWLLAAHFGPNDHHWNVPQAQRQCKAMLDWMRTNYPFCLDSIYMFGSSMGGAPGQIWHNNNCGLNDYFCAATAGGSPILDCQKRQEQYFAGGDTMRTMRQMFGGIPADGDCVLFQYHRNSVVFFADTMQAMYFNSLNLPVWMSWGNTVLEDTAYGVQVRALDSLRRADNADTTLIVFSQIANHGLYHMYADSVYDWLSHFTANRYPDKLSINADENDEYYWTRAVLRNDSITFGRYGVEKNFAERRLDVNMVRNMDSLEVQFLFPWPRLDSLNCHWQNHDASVQSVKIILQPVPEPLRITHISGDNVQWTYQANHLYLSFAHNAQFTIVFPVAAVDDNSPATASVFELSPAYPNPFNPLTTISFNLPRESVASVKVFDVTGRTVEVLQQGKLPAGVHRLQFDGSRLSSGIYFVRLEAQGMTSTRKMVLLK